MTKRLKHFAGLMLLMIYVFIASLIPVSAAPATPAPATSSFYNVIMQEGADPWMYKHTDGNYYFTKTTGGDVTIWRSSTISGVDAGERRVISTGCCGIWAPELHYINGAWYIYYAKDDGDNANHRMYVMENTSPDPFQGTFVNKGQITDNTNKWAIDGTVLNNGGELYFIWSGWEGNTNVRQNLYIAHMSNPWTIDSGRVEISRPDHSWETQYNPNVNEGPEVIFRNNTINLIYSASGSWTNDYCLGLITAEASSDLLNPASWSKRDQPIFSSGNGLFGPGHASFTKSPDGKEDWIIYHTAKYSGAGWNREIRAQRFTWNSDDTPNLGAPADPNTPIAVPSGEPARARYEGESGMFNKAYASSSATGSGGSKAGHIDFSDSYVEFSVNAPVTGDYILSARTGNGTAGVAWASHMLSVNGGEASSFWVTNKGWENWGTSTAILHLNKGDNTIRFAKGIGYAELDCFDIFPVEGKIGLFRGHVGQGL